MSPFEEPHNPVGVVYPIRDERPRTKAARLNSGTAREPTNVFDASHEDDFDAQTLGDAEEEGAGHGGSAVSYTHLTLPTILLV